MASSPQPALDPRSIGQAIAAIRGTRTVKALLALSGIRLAPETWSRYENGRVARPSLRTLSAIASALGVEVGTLLGAPGAGSECRGKTGSEELPPNEPSARGARYGEADTALAVCLIAEPFAEHRAEMRHALDGLKCELESLSKSIDGLREDLSTEGPAARGLRGRRPSP